MLCCSCCYSKPCEQLAQQQSSSAVLLMICPLCLGFELVAVAASILLRIWRQKANQVIHHCEAAWHGRRGEAMRQFPMGLVSAPSLPQLPRVLTAPQLFLGPVPFSDRLISHHVFSHHPVGVSSGVGTVVLAGDASSPLCTCPALLLRGKLRSGAAVASGVEQGTLARERVLLGDPLLQVLEHCHFLQYLNLNNNVTDLMFLNIKRTDL